MCNPDPSNGNAGPCAVDGMDVPMVLGGTTWQCVELAQRFMAQVYGTKAYQANGSQVVRNYRAAYGGGLVTIANGKVEKTSF